MEIVVVGRGAIGAIYCDAFSRYSGCQLRVAADRERVERYDSQRFYFNEQELKLNYCTPTFGDKVADLVIIATKWVGYSSALDIIEPIVGENTTILPLLNGLLPYDVAVERFGESRVLRGYYIGHTAMRDDGRVELGGGYRTIFGEKSNPRGCYSERVGRVIDIFEAAGVSYRVDEDMIYSRWLKFVINSGLNQVSALDGGLSYEDIRSSERLSGICRSLMDEAIEVATSLGVEGAGGIMPRAMELLSTLRGDDYSSMAQDVRAGRVTEWPLFGGYLIEQANLLGVAVPLHRFIEKEINI